MHQLREAEVGEHRRVVLLEQDVGRLDVPVDDADPVRVIEPGGDAAEILQRLGRIEPTVAQPVGEASSGDVLDDHVGRPQVLTEVVHVHDVRVAQLRDGLGLVPEPRSSVRVGCDRLQDLDRAGALELGVVGAVNETHGPLAYEVLDLVLPQLRPRFDRHGP